MRVQERRPATRQSVDARRFGHRMSTERTDPIILIVDGDEDDVGPVRRTHQVRTEERHE